MDDEYEALKETYRKLYGAYEDAVAEMLRQARDTAGGAEEFAFTARHIKRVSEQLAEIRNAMYMREGRRRVNHGVPEDMLEYLRLFE